jgi:hypothetical protein
MDCIKGFISGYITDIQVEGNRAELKIFNQNRVKAIEVDEGQILGILAFPLLMKRPERTIKGLSGDIFNRNTPLGASLSWQLDRRRLERHDEIYAVAGKGYITSFQLTPPPSEDISHLEEMENQA